MRWMEMLREGGEWLAAAANWHAAHLGKTNMRPGIEPPADAA